MKFKDIETGNILETGNNEAIRLMKGRPDKYEVMKEKGTRNTGSTKESGDIADNT